MSDPIAFRLDAATYDLLRRFAKDNGLSVGEASRFLVETALKRDPEQAAASTAIWRVQRNLRRGMARVTQLVADALRVELVKPFEDAAPEEFERASAPPSPEEAVFEDEESFGEEDEAGVDETPLEGLRRRRKRRGRRGGRRG
jgi:hypothetical protein